MTLQRGESGLFGDWIGITDRSGIRVASNRSRSSCLKSEGVEHVAESHGGPGDRRHEEGLPQHVFELKRVVFANLGARITVIASAGNGEIGGCILLFVCSEWVTQLHGIDVLSVMV